LTLILLYAKLSKGQVLKCKQFFISLVRLEAVYTWKEQLRLGFCKRKTLIPFAGLAKGMSAAKTRH
jgi:hypothetical protein